MSGLVEGAAQTPMKPAVQLKGDKNLIDRFEKQNHEAVELMKQGHYDDALRILDQCLVACEKELGPDDPYVGKILNNIGEARRIKADYRSALRASQRSLSIRETFFGSNHVEVATSLNNLAAIHLDQGDALLALPLFERSLAMRKMVLGTNSSDVAATLGNLAALQIMLGNLQEAKVLVLQSLTIKEKLFGLEDPETAISMNNLAVICQQAGNYGDALSFAQRSLSIRMKAFGPEHPETATALNNLATIYVDMGDDPSALPLYERSVAIRKRVFGDDSLEMAESLHNVAVLFSHQKQFADAQKSLQRSLTIREGILGADHELVVQSLNNLAGANQDLGQFNQALELYQRALQITEKRFGTEHPNVVTILNNLATVYSREKNFQRASSLYQLGLAICEKTLGPEHPTTITLLANLASAQEEQGNFPKSISIFSELLTRQRRNLAGQVPRLSDTDALHYLGFLLYQAEIFHSLCSIGAISSSTFAATSGAEQLCLNKGLLEEVRSIQAALEIDQTSTTVEARVRYQATQNKLLLPPDSKIKPAVRDARRQELQAELSKIEGMLATRVSLVAQSVRERSLSLVEVSRSVPPQSALVDFIQYRRYDFSTKPSQGKEQRSAVYLTFPLTGGSTNVAVERVDLGEAAPIDAALAIVTKRFSAVPAQYRAADVAPALQRLSDLVYAPLAKYLTNVSHLILCPDGQLNRLPFEMLPVGNKFLVEEKTISYVTSGREVVRLPDGGANAKSKNKNAKSVVMGNPDFDLDLDGDPKRGTRNSELGIQNQRLLTSSPTRALSRDYGGLKFKPLPGAEAEARAVAKLLGDDSVLRLGADAREAELKAVQSPRVLHLATHGFFLSDQEFKRTNSGRADLLVGLDARRRVPTLQNDWENPLLRCGIALAGANRTNWPSQLGTGNPERGIQDQEDGVLTGLEASLLNLQGTELVILSACDSGSGEVKIGEGVMSLRRAFRIAGAETVLASHWSVSDQATSRLMTEFMRRWRAGEPRGHAWREAQLSLIRTKGAKEDFSNPYFWSAFTLTGQWRGSRS